MADNTGIEWADSTWNPFIGCTRVSEGCRNCYAEQFANRFAGPGQRWDGVIQNDTSTGYKPRWTGLIRYQDKQLNKPAEWKKPRRIFVNSMSDTFHETVPDEAIESVFQVMLDNPQHTFMVLTKRPERMAAFLDVFWWVNAKLSGKTDHIWLGTSVENQEAADKRIPWLLKTPAVTRFLSCEPLLGLVDFIQTIEAFRASADMNLYPELRYHGLNLINWVIVGGESGHSARPVHPEWVRSLRDQCQEAGVPFFFKQWGQYIHTSQITASVRVGFGWKEFINEPNEGFVKVRKSKTGRELDGHTHDEYPGKPERFPI